jgi:hypothetical protein
MRAGVDKCILHGNVLREDKVKIAYGLFDYDRESERKLFPNSRTVAYGGCVVPWDTVADEPRPKYAKVLYCQQCRKVEREWRQDKRGS